jgi:hypothetical protein
MRDFCRTKAASAAAAGQEKRLFCMECEQRRAHLRANSEQHTDIESDRERARELPKGVRVRSRPYHRAKKKHETELVRITQARSTAGAENG